MFPKQTFRIVNKSFMLEIVEETTVDLSSKIINLMSCMFQVNHNIF